MRHTNPPPLLIALLCAFLLAANFARVFAQAQRGAFQPQLVQRGTLRIWGDTYMSSVVLAWEARFRKYHPEVQFDTRLMGTDTGMPGLYSGVADIALFGRASNTTENDGFLHTLQYRPLQLRLMTGSLNVAGMSYAPVLFVAKSNPLQHLTLTQVDAIFGCGQSGESAPAKTWGDVGLGGEWKDKPIHVYTFDMESGSGLFLLHALQGESRKMNWTIIREYSDERRSDGSIYESGQQTMDALRRDPYGLAVSGLRYADGEVKALALAVRRGFPYVEATRVTLIEGSYPLTRVTYAFVNQPPGQSVSPLVEEFLRFVYSNEGQSLIAASSDFLPLSTQDAAQQVLSLR